MSDPEQQIVDQLHEIAWILDRKDWDRLGEIFTDDAEGYGQQGLPAITANTSRYLGRWGPTQHLTGNHRIQVDGDRASSTSYIRAIHFSAPGRPAQHSPRAVSAEYIAVMTMADQLAGAQAGRPELAFPYRAWRGRSPKGEAR